VDREAAPWQKPSSYEVDAAGESTGAEKAWRRLAWQRAQSRGMGRGHAAVKAPHCIALTARLPSWHLDHAAGPALRLQLRSVQRAHRRCLHSCARQQRTGQASAHSQAAWRACTCKHFSQGGVPSFCLSAVKRLASAPATEGELCIVFLVDGSGSVTEGEPTGSLFSNTGTPAPPVAAVHAHMQRVGGVGLQRHALEDGGQSGGVGMLHAVHAANALFSCLWV
jgi:hypothetical protein